MVSNNARKLACDLIERHFGDLVGKVCSCLVYKGTLTMPEIARSTEMSAKDLKNCLLVLIQHNCVQPFRMDPEEGMASAKGATQYAIFVDIILHRMRFPKFLLLVREELGEEVESLFEGLLEHGRLSFEQSRERAKEQAEKGDLFDEDAFKDMFTRLVHSHYIERCPIAEPLLPAKSSSDQPKKVARGAASRIKQENSSETEAQRIAAAASPLEAERFLIPWSFDQMAENDLGSGSKRKYSTMGDDSRTTIRTNFKEILWRVNYEELVRNLRHKACITQVRSKLDLGSATVLEGMLLASRSSETTAKQQRSMPLSMDDILQAVRTAKGGLGMTMERIRGSLTQMASSHIGYLSRSSDNMGKYVINMHKIIQDARKSEMEAVVLNRFGNVGCRIFRLLAMKGPLEHTQISDQALVDRKETLEILYKLLKDNFVQLQEIAKSNEHAPSKTFYLWRVAESSLMDQIVDDMYHAASNLVQRFACELEKEQEVLELVNQMNQQSRSSDGRQSVITLTKSQQEQVKRIRKVAKILEASLLKLDESILLFHYF
eukprot:TRINITY_DN29148_c0_g1_i1.p1 TRINITY_DN29148_c0_g1~~TRINITY_DN29148_c0_g1_i1.p1  ORF type:complete len:546 (+),score=110.47 TRINITY_DN29148_c0_g1_i1:206-1843(+)